MNNLVTKISQKVVQTEETIKNQFEPNGKLAEFLRIKIKSPNDETAKGEKKDMNNANSNENMQTNEKLFSELREKHIKDSLFNYKKDFLVLTFDQTEDQNSPEYKRKALSNKVMSDLSFSLNKAFEFTFLDTIKNHIIMTLAKNPKEQNAVEQSIDTMSLTERTEIDNNFILNLKIEEPSQLVDFSRGRARKDTFMSTSMPGMSGPQMEPLDEGIITEVKPIYDDTQNKNEEDKDDDLDKDLYQFFLEFIEKNKGESLATKVKVVLDYINSVHPETNNPIYTNKEKNEIMDLWKREYDKAVREIERLQKTEKKGYRSSNAKKSTKNVIASPMNRHLSSFVGGNEGAGGSKKSLPGNSAFSPYKPRMKTNLQLKSSGRVDGVLSSIEQSGRFNNEQS